MNLKDLPDIKLIENIKDKKCSDSYTELKSRVEKCYYRTCERYASKVKSLKYNELIEDCDFVLNKSLLSFNPDKKTKFSSWVMNMSRFHVLNTIKSINEGNHFIPTINSEIDLLNNINGRYHFDDNAEVKDNIFYLLNKLSDERIKEIFTLRFYSDKESAKWKNISKRLNLSVQQCTNLFQRGKQLLYKKLNKNYKYEI